MTPRLSRAQIIRARLVRHDLHRDAGSLGAASDVALLDQGVQDTGPDGSTWALAVRGAPAPADDELFLAWDLRGAPHAHRRADVAEVAVATAPYSEADAAKRVFDASKGLRDGGLTVLEALEIVARHERRSCPGRRSGARVSDVAAFIDAPQKVVREHWPDDAIEISVTGLPGRATKGGTDADG